MTLFNGTWSDNSYAEMFGKLGGGDSSDSESDKSTDTESDSSGNKNNYYDSTSL
jgi:hypothetical protein